MRNATLITALVLSPSAFGITTIWQQEFLGSAVNTEGDSGNTLRARAFFHHFSDGAQNFLRIELTNAMTSTDRVDEIVNSDLLSSLFWTMGGTLTRHSASLGAGSGFFNEGIGWARDIGGEWGYRSGLNYRSVTGVHGVSAVGLEEAGFEGFSRDDRFNTNSNLDGHDPLRGNDFSLMPGFENVESHLNPNLTRNNPPALIRDTAVFLFRTSGSLLQPGQVWAQYGTSLGYPSILLTPTAQPPQGEPIPEPFTMALGAGALALAAARRRRKK